MGKFNIYDFLAICERINKCITLYELQEVLLNISTTYGVEYIFAGFMPPQGATPEVQLSSILFGEWPREWNERYFSRGYIDIDPVISYTRTNRKPIRWEALYDGNNKVMQEACEFKLNQGITIPMQTQDGKPAGMSFAGNRICNSPEALIILQTASAAATARAIDISNKSRSKTDLLDQFTPAEIRCLDWLSLGKTSWEIGKIEGISSRTVDKHIGSCITKTNSCNRLQLLSNLYRAGFQF